VFVVAVLLVGCGGSAERSASQGAAAHGTATPTSTPAADCPNTEGGVCLGLVDAGTYKTEQFWPRITYTVPDGWANYEDTPGNFLLVPPDGTLDGVDLGVSDYIGVYTAVLPAESRCSESAAFVDPTPAAIARAIRSRNDLHASKPESVSVGGLDGVVMDVGLADGWDKSCDFIAPKPFGTLMVGSSPSSFHHGIVPGQTVRLYLLDNGHQTQAIEVEDFSGGEHLDRYSRVVEAMRFDL
jgi:hypothetical protein